MNRVNLKSIKLAAQTAIGLLFFVILTGVSQGIIPLDTPLKALGLGLVLLVTTTFVVMTGKSIESSAKKLGLYSIVQIPYLGIGASWFLWIISLSLWGQHEFILIIWMFITLSSMLGMIGIHILCFVKEL